MGNISILTYQTFEWNVLSFELLVDGKPLAEYVGFRDNEDSKDNLIPYWIINEGFPVYKWTGEIIVAVCGCSEYGCDCVLCRAVKKADIVTFTDFRRERGSDLRQSEFKFTLKNFQDIESKLKAEADKKRLSFEKLS